MPTISSLNQLSVKKSNTFVNSYTQRYNQKGVTESVLVYAAIGRIQEKESTTKDPELVAELYPSELKMILPDPANIYRDLKNSTLAIMKNSTIMVFDDAKKEFIAMHMIREATYKNGVFRIVFENKLKPHILALERNYTGFELSIVSSFRSVGSLRLYELLKSERGLELARRKKIDKRDSSDEVICEYNVAQLKFLLGYADSTSQKVFELINRAKTDTDWEEAFDILDDNEKKYKRWSAFNERVLKVAQEELKEKSNIRFEYEPIKLGNNYKRIKFYTYSNVPTNPKVIDERAEYIKKTFRQNHEQLEIPYDLEEYATIFDTYVGHNGLSAEDINMLLEDCGGNQDLIKKAIISADEQDSIYNYIGWIRSFVKNGGYEEIKVIDGSAKVANRVEEVTDMYHKIPENASFAERVWARKPGDSLYFMFKNYLDEHEISLDDFNLAYSAEEKLIIYKSIIHKDNDVLVRYGLPV